MTKAKQPLLTTRSALILLLGVCAGTIVGVLTAMAGRTVAEAVLAGLVAASTSVVGFHNLIGS